MEKENKNKQPERIPKVKPVPDKKPEHMPAPEFSAKVKPVPIKSINKQ